MAAGLSVFQDSSTGQGGFTGVAFGDLTVLTALLNRSLSFSSWHAEKYLYNSLGRTTWIPGMMFATMLVVMSWGYLIYTGSISTIWPMFGVGNQLLATIALSVTTTFLVNSGKAKYAWATAIPMVFVGVTTLSAAVLSVTTIFWPMAHKSGTELQGYVDTALMSLFVVGVVLVVTAAMRRCWKTLHGEPVPADAFGAAKPEEIAVKTGCC